ncbi:MAG: hypothetical protein JWL93_1070 [Hyphomicrobiales bacterium]|nr:hypothetical protein [Hyphomicrobiales bacterium]
MSGRARLMSFLEGFRQTWTTRHFVRLDDFIDRKIIMHFAGSRSLFPLAGDYHGRAEVVQILQRLEVEFDLVSFRVGEIIGEGGKMSVRWSAQIANRGTGALLTTGGMAAVTFLAGRLNYCAIYVDTAAFASLMGWTDKDAPSIPGQNDWDRFSPRGPASALALDRRDVDAFFVGVHERWYEGRVTELVAAHFHPQARLRFAGSGLFPRFSGTHIGHAPIISAFRSLMLEFERLHGHIDDILAEGNRVSVHSSLRLRHRETQRVAEMDICDTYVMNFEGQIIDWIAYCDTGVLAQLAERGEASPR